FANELLGVQVMSQLKFGKAGLTQTNRVSFADAAAEKESHRKKYGYHYEPRCYDSNQTDASAGSALYLKLLWRIGICYWLSNQMEGINPALHNPSRNLPRTPLKQRSKSKRRSNIRQYGSLNCIA